MRRPRGACRTCGADLRLERDLKIPFHHRSETDAGDLVVHVGMPRSGCWTYCDGSGRNPMTKAEAA